MESCGSLLVLGENHIKTHLETLKISSGDPELFTIPMVCCKKVLVKSEKKMSKHMFFYLIKAPNTHMCQFHRGKLAILQNSPRNQTYTKKG